MSVGQQEDLGILAQAAIRWMLKKPAPETSLQVCSAVAHVVPLLSETCIRTLMYEVDTALHTNTGPDQHYWAELMTVLRRIDRP